jgi:hypothetical protein
MNAMLCRRIAVAACALLAACDDVAISTEIGKPSPETRQSMMQAASGGPVLIEIVGRPLTGSRPFDAERVADLANAAFALPWLRFTADRAKAPHAAFRVVVIVDPPPALGAETGCRADAASGAVRRAELIELKMFFCHEVRALSGTRGSVRRPVTGDEWGWNQLVKQMARQLLD